VATYLLQLLIVKHKRAHNAPPIDAHATTSDFALPNDHMPPAVKTLLINLDRSPDRLQNMTARLARIGLEWERVPGIDGKALDLANDPRVSLPDYRRLHGKALNPSEVGCYLSHIAACTQFLSDPSAKYALILEDDVDFADDFQQVLDDLVGVEHDWDMVKLSGFHSGTPVRPKYAVGQARRLCVMLSRHTGAAAYLINRRMAHIYVNQLLPMRVPYDHAFDKGWEWDVKLRMVAPLPTALSWEPTTMLSGQSNPYRRLPWHQRLGTYAYRARTEAMRGIYGLSQWLKG
jgi:glycosyl transferase family 25